MFLVILPSIVVLSTYTIALMIDSRDFILEWKVAALDALPCRRKHMLSPYPSELGSSSRRLFTYIKDKKKNKGDSGGSMGNGMVECLLLNYHHAARESIKTEIHVLAQESKCPFSSLLISKGEEFNPIHPLCLLKHSQSGCPWT